MRRFAAAALALLLTGSPAVAGACALACPVPSSAAAASAADMPADCAAMHHVADSAAAPSAAAMASGQRLVRTEANGCCAMTTAPGDVPPASVERAAPLPVAAVPVVIPVRGAAPSRDWPSAQVSPPGASIDRARRTDVLRL